MPDGNSKWKDLCIFAPTTIEISLNTGVKIVRRVDFRELNLDGSVHVISGINGAGKTITLEAVEKFCGIHRALAPKYESIQKFRTKRSHQQINCRFSVTGANRLCPDERNIRRIYNRSMPLTLQYLLQFRTKKGEFDKNKVSQFFGCDYVHEDFIFTSSIVSNMMKYDANASENWHRKRE